MKSILIIGAGPTGLTAAVELARRGFQPRIIDLAAGHPVESRALAVNARTLRILEPSGLTAAFLDQGNPVRGMRALEKTSAGDFKTLIRLNLSEGTPPYNFTLILPQADTERILAGGLSNYGIAIEWNTEVTNLHLEGGRAVVNIDGANGAEEIRPDIVLGADGSHSVVRKSLGIGFEGERHVDPFGLMDVNFGRPIDHSELQLRFSPEGLMGLIPISSETGRFVATKPRLLETLPAEFEITDRPWQTEFHVSFRHVECFQRGNVFLAGDAAHIHSPVGGRGMNLGIEDAAWFAWLLSNGQSERYTADRLPPARHVLRLTKQQTWFVSERSWFANVMRRNVIPNLLRLGFVRRQLLKSMQGFDTREPPWLS